MRNDGYSVRNDGDLQGVWLYVEPSVHLYKKHSVPSCVSQYDRWIPENNICTRNDWLKNNLILLSEPKVDKGKLAWRDATEVPITLQSE